MLHVITRFFEGQEKGGGGVANGKAAAGSVKVAAWKGVGGDDHVPGEDGQSRGNSSWFHGRRWFGQRQI